MQSVTFQVPGKPQGKARAKTVRNKSTGNIHSYTPEKDMLYENYIKAQFQNRANGFYLERGKPVMLRIIARFLPPKSVSKKRHTPGLHRRTDREQIVGFDKRLSAEAVAKNKKVQKEVALKIRNDKIKEELTEAKIRGVPRINPDKIDVSEFSFDAGHINAEREHSVSREEAERFIKEADISLTRWNGRFVNYYGPNGAVYVDTENNNIRTAFKKEQFDEQTLKIREVAEKYGIKKD